MPVALPITAPSSRPAPWSLAFGNVVIGTGALAFVGRLATVVGLRSPALAA